MNETAQKPKCTILPSLFAGEEVKRSHLLRTNIEDNLAEYLLILITQDCSMKFLPQTAQYHGHFRGVARIFQRGGHRGGLSRIIAAWRPIWTKDKSRWRKYITKKQILKNGLFNNGFYGQDIVMAFSPPEYCTLFAQKKAYQGGSRAPQHPPSYVPALVKAKPWWQTSEDQRDL